MLTPVLVIGGIVGGIVTPTESAIIAAGYALILGVFVYRTVSVRDLGGIFYDTGRFASISLFAIGTASAFGWMLAFYNVPRLIVDVLTAHELGVIGTSLIIAALFLFFGLFIDAIPTIIILGTVLLPVARAAAQPARPRACCYCSCVAATERRAPCSCAARSCSWRRGARGSSCLPAPTIS